MLRALLVAGIAAVAGHQLYKRGLIQRAATYLQDRAETLKRHAEDRLEQRHATHEAAGGPGGGPVRPMAIHKHQLKPAA